MMGVVTDLLNAQRRPTAEAGRLTAAITAAMDAVDDTTTAAEIATAVSASCARVNQEIAYEKLPPAAVADSAGATFGDEVHDEATLSDEGRDIASPIGASAHFQIDGHDDPANVDAPQPDPAEMVPTPDSADVPPPQTPATPAEPEAAPTEGPEDSDSEESVHEAPDESVDDGVDGDGESAEAGADESEDDGDDDDDDESTEADESEDADDDDYDESEGGARGLDDESHGADVPDPSPLYQYDALPDPWGDQEELPVDDDSDGDVDEGDGDVDEGDDDDEDVVPSPTATAPPQDMGEPMPSPEAGFKERASDRVRDTLQWVRANQKKARLYGGVAAGVVLVIAGLLASVSGNRGRPPLPRNEIITQGSIDNPEVKPDTKTLTPSVVSASCGNDSDAVAPFSANKSRAWVCQRIDNRDLNALNIQFASYVVIETICVVPGWDYVAPDGRDEWARHRIASSVTWRMGGKAYPQKLTATRTGVCSDFPSVETKEMSMTITASVRPTVGAASKGSGGGIGGKADDDVSKVDETTAISSIVIKGRLLNPGGE